MTIQEEIELMLDYLGMDKFPEDGYHPPLFPYDGNFIDGYDGYQVTLEFTKRDTPKGYGLTARRRAHAKHGKTPRDPIGLCVPYEEGDDDPPEIEIEEEDNENDVILAAMHASLVALCKEKAYKETVQGLTNDELDAQSLPWCKS